MVKHFLDARFKQIMSNIIKQKMILKDHEAKLDHISFSLDQIQILLTRVLERNDENNPINETTDIFESLPICNLEDFNKIESLLQDRNVRDKFVSTKSINFKNTHFFFLVSLKNFLFIEYLILMLFYTLLKKFS